MPVKGTISEYVHEALKRAVYEFCSDIKQWCAYVRELPGCWAQGKNVEEARNELAEVIEGWVILALQHGDPIPALNGVTALPA